MPGSPRVLADRAYGKVKDQVEFDLSDDIVERLESACWRQIESLSDSELDEKIAKLEEQLSLPPSKPRHESGKSGVKATLDRWVLPSCA